jgi:hypothetical protein
MTRVRDQSRARTTESERERVKGDDDDDPRSKMYTLCESLILLFADKMCAAGNLVSKVRALFTILLD